MSNIDKRALREELSNPEIGSNAHLRKLALALLDELESKDNRINRLEAIVAVAEQRNALMREWKRALKVPCDLVDDQVPVVIHGMVIRLERLKETEAKLEAAEKRIADLEAREVRLPELCVGVVQGGHAVMVPYAAGHWFNKTAILEMLTDAGINIAAAGKGE